MRFYFFQFFDLSFYPRLSNVGRVFFGITLVGKEFLMKVVPLTYVMRFLNECGRHKETIGMRLSVVKQSFFGPPGQYGRLVTKANCQLRRFVVSSCPCRPFVVHFIGNKQNDNFRFSFGENTLFRSILIFKHEAG